MTSMREELKAAIGYKGVAVIWNPTPPHRACYGFSCVICQKNIAFMGNKETAMQIHNHVRRHTAAELRAWWICKVMADPVPDIPS